MNDIEKLASDVYNKKMGVALHNFVPEGVIEKIVGEMVKCIQYVFPNFPEDGRTPVLIEDLDAVHPNTRKQYIEEEEEAYQINIRNRLEKDKVKCDLIYIGSVLLYVNGHYEWKQYIQRTICLFEKIIEYLKSPQYYQSDLNVEQAGKANENKRTILHQYCEELIGKAQNYLSPDMRGVITGILETLLCEEKSVDDDIKDQVEMEKERVNDAIMNQVDIGKTSIVNNIDSEDEKPSISVQKLYEVFTKFQKEFREIKDEEKANRSSHIYGHIEYFSHMSDEDLRLVENLWNWSQNNKQILDRRNRQKWDLLNISQQKKLVELLEDINPNRYSPSNSVSENGKEWSRILLELKNKQVAADLEQLKELIYLLKNYDKYVSKNILEDFDKMSKRIHAAYAYAEKINDAYTTARFKDQKNRAIYKKDGVVDGENYGADELSRQIDGWFCEWWRTEEAKRKIEEEKRRAKKRHKRKVEKEKKKRSKSPKKNNLKRKKKQKAKRKK